MVFKLTVFGFFPSFCFQVCELIKESTLYKSFKVNRDKICLDRLPTISYTGVLLPEQCIFAVGLSLAALGGIWAHDLIGRTQIDCILRKSSEEDRESSILATVPPLLFQTIAERPTKTKLIHFCERTIRIGQLSCFWLLPTACVSMKHSILVHGLSAFFFFGLACVHVCCTYVIQYNLIVHKLVQSSQFEKSFRFKGFVLLCALAFFFIGCVVYLSLRFTSYQLYLYTIGGALGQYTTVLWLMAGYGSYYVDLTILIENGEKSRKQQEISL